MFESSVGFTPRKRIKVNNVSFFINQIVNVVTVNSADYVSDENYHTIIDSGASSHIIKNIKYVTLEFNYRPANPNDGVALGDNSIKLCAIGYCDIGILKHITIISGPCLDLLGYAILIKDQTAQLIKDTKLIAKGLHIRIRGLYHVKLRDFIPPVDHVTNVALASKQSSSTRRRGVVRNNPEIQTALNIELLHKRIGHANKCE